MTVNNIDVEVTIARVNALIADEKGLWAGFFIDVDGYKLILRLIFRAFSINPRADTQALHFSTSSDA